MGHLDLGILFLLSLLFSLATSRSYIWRDLTSDELQKWYTPTELCLLDSKDIRKFPQDVRQKECTNFSGGSRRLHCQVGMGSNSYPCYGPFSAARPHFKRGVEGYTDASSKPLLKAFQHFAATNTTLVMLGDSTMRQKLQAMQCELHREHRQIKTKGNLYGILPCETRVVVTLPDGQTLDIIALSIGPNSVTCLKGSSRKAKGAFQNAAHVIQEHNIVSNRSVFVVANMGLWYNDESAYEAVVPSLFEWLQRVAVGDIIQTHHFPPLDPVDSSSSSGNSVSITSNTTSATIASSSYSHLRNTVVWHETLSQHWINGIGSGYFSKHHANKQEQEDWKELDKIPTSEYLVPNCCSRITNTSSTADWRNGIANGYLKEHKYRNITIFPVAEITRPLEDLHTCNPLFRHDCTHYCFTPLLFQPLWHQIAELATTGRLISN